jgi:hypothetical protein
MNQEVGAMLLSSFVIMEGLVLCNRIYTIHKTLPGSPDASNTQRIKERLEPTDFMLLAFSAWLYGFTLFWAMLDIHGGCDPYGPSLVTDP